MEISVWMYAFTSYVHTCMYILKGSCVIRKTCSVTTGLMELMKMNTTCGRVKSERKMRLTLMSFERLSRRKMYVREELILSILSLCRVGGDEMWRKKINTERYRRYNWHRRKGGEKVVKISTYTNVYVCVVRMHVIIIGKTSVFLNTRKGVLTGCIWAELLEGCWLLSGNRAPIEMKKCVKIIEIM